MKHFAIVALILLAGALTGCVSYQPVQFAPVNKTTPVAPKFSQSYYYVDRDRNLYFVMRSNSTDPASGKPIAQVATIRVFWHPKGGVTTLNATAINATFRYVLMTPDAIGMYEGAGFVRLNSKDAAKKFEAHVIDGDMRLTQASATFKDTLGRAHISGYFSALYDDARAVDMLLDAHREFYARSLLSTPATQPAAPPPSPNAEDWGVPSTLPAGLSPFTPATSPASTVPQ